jgi:integrase
MWLRVILTLAVHCGLRRSDCLRAAPQHYDRERKTLTIQQKKTGQIAALPVTSELAQLLEAIPADADPRVPFYVHFRGKPIDESSLNQQWQALKKKSAVNPGLRLHDLRRTLAVSLYEVSKDLRVVEQMLGHQSLETTIHYLEHRDPEKLRPYIQMLHTPKGPVQ